MLVKFFILCNLIMANIYAQQSLYETYFEKLDFNNKNITYKFNEDKKGSNTVLGLVNNVKQDTISNYTSKVFNNPIPEYERFLNAIKAVDTKSDSYVVFKNAIKAVSASKDKNKDVMEFLLTTTERFRSYPYTKIWSTNVGGEFPNITITFYIKTVYDIYVIMNTAIKSDPKTGIISIIFGQEVTSNTNTITDQTQYLGMSSPRLEISIKPKTITEATTPGPKLSSEEEKKLNAQIKNICIKDGQCISKLTKVSNEQRNKNLQKIQENLMAQGIPIQNTEYNRKLQILGTVDPKNITDYLNEFPVASDPYFKSLKKDYESTTADTRKEWAGHIVYNRDGLVRIAELMDKYGKDKVLSSIHKIESLTSYTTKEGKIQNGYIGLALSNLGLVEAYIKDPNAIENNINYLRSKGLDYGSYFITTNNLIFTDDKGFVNEKNNLIKLIMSPTLKQTVASIQKAVPDIDLFHPDKDDWLHDRYALITQKFFRNIEPLLDSEQYREFAEKHPELFKEDLKFHYVIDALKAMTEKGYSIDEYYKVEELLLKIAPNVLHDSDSYENLADYIKYGDLSSKKFTNDILNYLNTLDLKNVTLSELTKLVNNYTPETASISKENSPKDKDLKIVSEQASINEIEKTYGIPKDELVKNKEVIEPFKTLLTYNLTSNAFAKVLTGREMDKDPWENIKDPKKVFRTLCKHNINDLTEKYKKIFKPELPRWLSSNNNEDDLEETLSFLEAKYPQLLEIKNKIDKITGKDFKFESLEKDELLHYLSLNDEQLRSIKKNLKILDKKKYQKYGEGVKKDLTKGILENKTPDVDKSDPKDIMSLIKLIDESLLEKEKDVFGENQPFKRKYIEIKDLANEILNKKGTLSSSKEFVNNLAKTDIRVCTTEQISALGTLLDVNEVQQISKDKDLLTKIKTNGEMTTVPLCTWGTLEALYNNPRIRHQYLAKNRKGFINNIQQNLSKKLIQERQIKDGFTSSTTEFSSINKLNYLDLISIQMILDFIEEPSNNKKIAELLLTDEADTRTEYGGLFLVENNKMDMVLDYNDFKELPVKEKYKDGSYSISDSFKKKYRQSISSFHFHAVHESDNSDRSEYAGPSGTSLFGNEGDLSMVNSRVSNDIVFTFNGVEDNRSKNGTLKVIYNVKWYGAVYLEEGVKYSQKMFQKNIDLGLYEADITAQEYNEILRSSKH